MNQKLCNYKKEASERKIVKEHCYLLYLLKVLQIKIE